MSVQHAVEVDPKRHVVEFENDRVRVVRIRYGAGEKIAEHSHEPGFLVFITDQHIRFKLPDGSFQEVKAKAGQARWMDAVTHEPQVISNHPTEAVYIEVKQQAGEE